MRRVYVASPSIRRHFNARLTNKMSELYVISTPDLQINVSIIMVGWSSFYKSKQTNKKVSVHISGI